MRPLIEVWTESWHEVVECLYNPPMPWYLSLGHALLCAGWLTSLRGVWEVHA